jgi:PEGA domain
MRLQWLGHSLLALALGALVARNAGAQGEGSSTAVLGVEAIDVPPALSDEISEQLRQRVSASRDMRLVSGKDLVEVKLVFACADETATCMAQAGKSLDAQKLIYGSVKKVGDDFAIWLKMFDVRKAKIEFWLTETLPRRQADQAGIKLASNRWFAKLTGRPMNAGTVQVTANLYGAVVSMDGVPAGATGEQPLIIADVAPGKHEVTLVKPGHYTTKQQFMVAAGQTTTVALTLQVASATTVPNPAVRTSEAAVRPQPNASRMVDQDRAIAPGVAGPSSKDSVDDGRGGYRTGFWVTLGAGIVSGVAAVKFGRDVVDINSQLDPYRRFPCAGNPAQLCGNTGLPRPALTQDERNKVGNLNDEGSRAQTLQWIGIVVAPLLGAASGYLLYKGYIDTDDDHAVQHAQRGLRIFPTAGASTGGILAEFDF